MVSGVLIIIKIVVVNDIRDDNGVSWGGVAYPILHPTKNFCLYSSSHSPVNLVGWDGESQCRE